jgi:hypothetical protein
MWHLHFGWFVYCNYVYAFCVLSLKSVVINLAPEIFIMVFYVNDTLSS